MTFVDVELVEGLGLPYIAGAEVGLLDASLDPIFNSAWQAFVAAFPGQTLLPLFDALPAEQIADLIDGIRLNGDEPPNPFVWFELSCDDAVADAVIAAVQALPMVIFAERRLEGAVAATISYGTNPRAQATLQIHPSPIGVDAIYAWHIAGGAGDGALVADIEHGWRLDHEELVSAQIRRISVFGSLEVDHGTAVGGIVVGGDNGVGTIGIVPNAEFGLITADRGTGTSRVADSIMLAAGTLAAGDVLLLQLGHPFAPGNKGEILLEFQAVTQRAIAIATKRGITVIEPAGNGNRNLDAFPFLAHTRPGSPTFVDSGAVVVGAGELNVDTNTWSRASFSSFGSRVNCFAAGTHVLAPSSTSTNTYQQFTGTSAASAIVAGVAASLQAMTRAAGRGVLMPQRVRELLSSATLGTLTDDPLGSKIGTMPDLREIARAERLVRILPVGAAFIGLNALLIVHLDADNHMVRRHFTLLTGWGQPIPTPTFDGSPSLGDTFELTAAQPAVASTDETDPIDRLVFDAFFSGPGGIHHMFWDSFNQAGDISKPIVGFASVAQGGAIAAVRARINLQVLAAINPQGRLIFITGDPQSLLTATSAPAIISALGNYRRVAGPTMISRGVGLVDIVAIEDGGSLNWFTGLLPATGTGSGLSGPFIEPSAVQFDPGARPALISTGSLLLTAAVGTDGSLRVASIDPVLLTIDVPIEVDATVSIARDGPVGLGRTALNVVVVAVDTQNTVRAATRPITGGSWTPLIPLLSLVQISPLGGVTVVSIDLGVMAIAVGIDGVVCSALSVDGLIWSPLVPLP